MKIFRGTGTPEAYQPNYQFGYMTNTQQLKPMGDAGAGLRFELRPGSVMRTEIPRLHHALPRANHPPLRAQIGIATVPTVSSGRQAAIRQVIKNDARAMTGRFFRLSYEEVATSAPSGF
jgi:hypothetical protein